jgi:hypothetical protein
MHRKGDRLMKELQGRFILTLAATVFGCGLFAASPDEVARDFWDASVDGDFDLAAEYVTEASRHVLERAEDAPEVEEVALGEIVIDGDRANVHTTLSAMMNDRPIEVEFNTMLEKEDGEWRVNLTATSGQMISKIMGGAAGEIMSQFGQAMGEQMRGIMEGMMKGLAEGMQEMGSEFQSALDTTSNVQR